ncbi:hypothetical protein FWD20_03465 [Candidatus Saccharibacteria bacterium]|nr:hypothetical protein [Candidatus Saccharibacteria bacterium]
MSITASSSAPKSRRRLSRIIVSVSIFVIIAGAGAWAVLNRQNIIDQITVWQFNMPSAVAALADDSGMSVRGKFVFHASRPELNDHVAFNQNCEMRESQAVILGCFAGGRIFIFNVTDPRIYGIRTVTAAHEMLHAAYARLSASERKKVDRLLEKQFERTTDQTLLDLIEIYEKAEPGQKLNELHSLFGTEVSDLDSELEAYYEKYFADRARVVTIYQEYHQVFADLSAEVSALEKQLESESRAIAAALAEHEKGTSELAADITEFNNCADTLNCFASQAAFDRARAALMTRQAKLKETADQINAQVEKYNAGVADLNALGIEAKRLNQSIDSHAPTIE